MDQRLYLHPCWLVGGEDGACELAGGLHGSFCPAVLLDLERAHVGGQLSGGDEIPEEHELPAGELSAIGQVEILGQRVVLPATCILNAGALPDTGGAVEVEELSGAVACGVLQDKVPVEQHSGQPREQGVLLVEVSPPGLDHTDALAAQEVRHGHPKEVRRGHEVGVEHCKVLTARDLHARLERTGLEADPVSSADNLHVDSCCLPARGSSLGDRGGVIGGVVEDLDLQLVGGPVQGGSGVDEALDDVALVEHRELNGHHRQRAIFTGLRGLFSQLPVDFGVVEPLAAIQLQQSEDAQVCDHD